MYDGAERVDDFEEDFPEDYPENEDHRELGTDIEQGLAQIGENEGYRGWGGWADYLDRPENFVALNGVNGAQRQDRIGRRGRGGDGRGGREGHDLGHRPAGTVDYGDDQGWVDAGGPHAMPEEWGEDIIRFWATLEARRAETYSWIPEEVRPAEIARREQECRHERSQWQRVPGAARCRACEWRADVFYMWCRGCYLIACRDCHSRPELFRERFGPPDHSEDIEVEGSELEEATYNEFSRMPDSGSDHEDDIADPWSLPASEESPDYSESELGDSQPQPGINTGRGDEIGSCLRTAEQIQLFRSEVLQEAERRLAGALQRFQAAADNFWDVHVRYPGMQDADVEEGEIYEARVWWLEAARKLTDAQQDMRRLDGNECARVRI